MCPLVIGTSFLLGGCGDHLKAIQRPKRTRSEGKVGEIVYDACGCFEGFTLRTCDGERVRFRSSDLGVERVVRKACADGLTLVVYHVDGEIRRLMITCC
jgi:hypothetical protein